MTTNRDSVLYAQTFQIRGNDFEHGGEVASKIKEVLRELGIDSAAIRRLSIANFEAEMNVIMYADEGRFDFSVTAGRLEVLLSDHGRGIPDINLAMQEGWSTATPEMRARGFGAGLGLPNIKKNTDHFEIESKVGVGTTLHYWVNLA
ncbi:MAG: ATP-binding protein [Pseudomonadota bacterium]